MILKMSITSGIFIIIVLFIRRIAFYHFPKRMFLLLWETALLRLLLPFSVPSRLSIYTLINVFHDRNESYNPETTCLSVCSILFPLVCWLLGFFTCLLLFLFTHHRHLKIYRTALPVDNILVKRWCAKHPLQRRIKICQSDQICTPLTYGLFHPVILLPKALGQEKVSDVSYILTHEYIHIKRCDVLLKWLFATVVCIHWFNPCVWIMYFYANRDIELACDEAVVSILGEKGRIDYAATLIRFEEKRGFVLSSTNYFSKKPLEERVMSIMEGKKKNIRNIAISVLVFLCTITLFGTDASPVSAGYHTVASEYEYKRTDIDSTTQSVDFAKSKEIIRLTDGITTDQDVKNGQLLFLKDGHESWKMNQGETISLDIHIKDFLEDGQYAVIGYVMNDLYTDLFSDKIITQQSIDFTAPKTGEYYFYFIGASSDTIRIQSFSIL